MYVRSTIETLSPTRIRLAVEVPFDELRPSLDRAYKSIAGQVRVPGFRPGKAPARIIDQRVGRATVLQEAIQDAIPQAYAEAVNVNKVRVLGQPAIELTKLDDGQSVEFTAEVDVRPEVTLPDLTGLSATVEDAEVTGDEVDQQVSALRERFGVLEGVSRPVASGDYVSIDLLATVDGAEVEGGSTTGLSYEVGSEQLVPGLDEAIVGMDSGESKTFPTELVAGEHAGSTAEVTVTVRSVKEKNLPALDDDFAQTASEFDTLEELRSDIESRLSRVKTLQQVAEARDKVLDALLDATEVPLPESPVASELEWRQDAVTQQLDGAGLALDSYLEEEGKTREEWEAELREGAERAVKTQLVLDAAAESLQISVSDAELSDHIVMQAQRYGMAPQDFVQRMSQAGNLPSLVADVRRNKALLKLVEEATVTDASGRPVDVAAIRGQMEAGENSEPDAEPDAGPGAGADAVAQAGAGDTTATDETPEPGGSDDSGQAGTDA